ncbi:hypothetical protein ACFPVX_10880 [Cohnella faecalis]|uniref:Uncharacterized protein n=1 Tax=Cohnella faecalis TaxID=2315694 RepID=A0A398CNL0_9BACL|nr:hypothetical protein [Cohnella faecalis]RIE03830.1 hypothetical protein D3H35_09765 [Cohnella faecalis]
MIEKWRHIGEEIIRFRLADEEAARVTRAVLGEMFSYRSSEAIADMTVTIRSGYGSRYADHTSVAIGRDDNGLFFDRQDFQLRISADDLQAEIRFHDYYGLRTALLSWYSSIINRADWGIVVRSSCVVNEGQACLFIGASDARESTIASLSRPRVLLSDETSLIRIFSEGSVRVYDSPFRNVCKEPANVGFAPLQRIYLLRESPIVRTTPLPKDEAMLMLLNEVVHENRDAGESAKLVRMCKRLVERVPVYEMELEKNKRVWGAIS